MPWLFYALLAPLFFAVNNVLDKFLRDKRFSTFTLAVFVGLSSFWILALVPFVDLSFPSAKVVILGLVAGALFFSNSFPYFQALSIEEASRVIPLWALQAPMVLLLAFVFLNERLLINDYAGFVLVVSGTFLVTARKVRDVLKLSKAFFLMLLASFVTAIGITISKRLYSEASFWAVQLLLSMGVGLAALLSLLVWGNGRRLFASEMLRLKKITALQLGLRQLVFIAAALLFGMAVMTGSASLTVALVNLAALYVFIIATLLSRFWPHILLEKIDKKALLTKALAIAMILAGLFLLQA